MNLATLKKTDVFIFILLCFLIFTIHLDGVSSRAKLHVSTVATHLFKLVFNLRLFGIAKGTTPTPCAKMPHTMQCRYFLPFNVMHPLNVRKCLKPHKLEAKPGRFAGVWAASCRRSTIRTHTKPYLLFCSNCHSDLGGRKSRANVTGHYCMLAERRDIQIGVAAEKPTSACGCDRMGL